MADHHHHHHRPHRLSVPPRSAATLPTTPRPSYPVFPYPPSTPTPTPSKHRLSTKFSFRRSSSLSSLFFLLFSLRSLYSVLPFLRSSPSSFSLFPFSFLVSLLSFLLTLSFSFFTSSSSTHRDPFRHKQNQPIFSLTSITQSQHKLLVAKSILLAVVFLLRFQALRYCGTAAMILAELSGNVAALFVADGGKIRNFPGSKKAGSSKVGGFIALFLGLLFLSVSWDRMECFPLSSVNVNHLGISFLPGQNCVRIWPMLLPFICGFLGCYERVSMNWGSVRELGSKRVRLISLFFTTVVLFIPAVVSMFVFEAEGETVSITNLGWPLANTVVFGVLLSENYNDEKLATSRDMQKEYLITFFCTLLLELFYFPELSLWGLLICGLLLWVAVRRLNPIYYANLEFGSSESITDSVMKPIRHILSERKSRKIALFLLINTAYMVVEFIAGFMSNSLGLISDACHMLFDCAALAIGLYASYISRFPANNQFNYGRGRFEVLSGYANAVFLVLVGALIVLESFERILDPQEISTSSLLSVSIGGLVVNVIGLIFFHEEHHHAHGGTCSHSHSHPQSESRHHHHSHDHNDHVDCKPQNCISVVDDGHEISCRGSDYHEHHDSTTNQGAQETDSTQCHGHDHLHSHGHHHHQGDLNDQHTHGSTSSNSNGCAHDHSIECHAGDHLHSDRKKQTKHDHRHIDHNMEGIFLHVLADTMGSVGVLISTLLIQYKGWLVADPACSIFISIMIVASVIPLLRNSAEILLQRVPRAHEQDLKGALNDVMKVQGVHGVQNMHAWSFTNSEVIGTLHLQVSSVTDKASAKARVLNLLQGAGIKDLTLQVECVENS